MPKNNNIKKTDGNQNQDDGVTQKTQTLSPKKVPPVRSPRKASLHPKKMRLNSAEGQSFEFDILYRVSEQEKEQILKDNPGLAPTVFIFDSQHQSKPFKIVLGSGTFSKARLARYEDTSGKTHYFAIRKVKSADALYRSSEHHSREQAVNMTRLELQLHKKIGELASKLDEKNHLSLTWISIEKNNKRGEPQLYQFIPLCDIGDGYSLLNLMTKEALPLEEKQALFRYIATTFLRTICKLNAVHAYHRDIKPSNTLFSTNTEPKLADLGSAVIYSNEQSEPIMASNMSDMSYIPPYNLIYQYMSKQNRKNTITSSQNQTSLNEKLMRNADHDSWALALTLLQLWDNETADFIKKTFLEYGRKYHHIIENSSPDDLVTLYQNAFNKLILLPSMQLMQADIKDIILNILRDKLNPALQSHQTLSGILARHQLNADKSTNHQHIFSIFKKMTASRISEFEEQKENITDYLNQKP